MLASIPSIRAMNRDCIAQYGIPGSEGIGERGGVEELLTVIHKIPNPFGWITLAVADEWPFPLTKATRGINPLRVPQVTPYRRLPSLPSFVSHLD